MQTITIAYQANDVDGLILAKKMAHQAHLEGVEASLTSDLSNIAKQPLFVVGSWVDEHTLDELATVLQVTVLDYQELNTDKAWHAAKHKAFYQPNQDQSSHNQSRDKDEAFGQNLSFVAITACPTGVAHTFMAAENLEKVAHELGYAIKVETQGSVGAKNILSDDEIAAADFVILACDIEVNADRFVGKKVYRTSTAQALKQTKQTFANAINHASVHGASHSAQAGSIANKSSSGKSNIYKHLMTGVSFMLPIVVAGGLLIALSFVFGINAFEQQGSLADVLMRTGKAAFALMIPILSGYIAYSVADRAGLAAGLIGGFLSVELGAGFLGAIVSGFLAGYTALFLVNKLKLPQTMEALKPILIIPLLSSLVVGLMMFYVVGMPMATILSAMESFLDNLGTGNLVLLGAVLGGMMCVDMGGPINKAAYTFSVGLLTLDNPNQFPIAAAMAGGMVPAIGMGIATMLAKNKFSPDEQNAGKAAFVLGLCFISEGAIPFAAKDPSRVLPSCIIGGAITGGLVGLFGATVASPHGGVFVLFIPNAINKPMLYLVAIFVGSMITGLLYALTKPRDKLALAIDS